MTKQCIKILNKRKLYELISASLEIRRQIVLHTNLPAGIVILSASEESQ